MAQDASIWTPGEGEQIPGPPGPAGPAGPPIDLTIGTVEQGITASATITGGTLDKILNLVLPRGNTGPQGNPGPSINLKAGNIQMGETVDMSITGTPPNLFLNLTIPISTGPQGPMGPEGDQGPKGDKGDKGDPGEDGTVIQSSVIPVTTNLVTWTFAIPYPTGQVPNISAIAEDLSGGIGPDTHVIVTVQSVSETAAEFKVDRIDTFDSAGTLIWAKDPNLGTVNLFVSAIPN